MGMDAGGGRIRRRTVVFQYCCDSPPACSASMGAAFAWVSAWLGGGLFSVVNRLYKPRRETPRDEPYNVDACVRSYSQWPGHSRLLHPAATAEQCLPAMWQCRAAGIQLLPSLQPQTEPELSAGPAPGWRK